MDGVSLHVEVGEQRSDESTWHWGMLEEEHVNDCISSLLGATLKGSNLALNEVLLGVNNWLEQAREELAKRVAANK